MIFKQMNECETKVTITPTEQTFWISSQDKIKFATEFNELMEKYRI